ncbi:restriction endonuclease subunit S [Lysinibacillus xylanilyticus]|uniref:restriction endonuclease subunit S n=1 Tax=Lysinibacillus xylanilyticus TaxID=582475 RepID=UPI003801D173
MKNKRIPDIRFPGYTGNWERRKLDKILKERKVNQKITKEVPLLAFAAGQGVIDRSERKTNNRDFLTKDATKKTYLLTKYDDIVYNPSNLKYGAIDRNKHGQGVISPIYVTFETDEIPSFIELIVKSENFKQRALQYEEGTVTKRQSVKPENLLCLNIVLPNSKDEQMKIGDFFKQLDDIIALHQNELTSLKETKQGFLQKMFPKEGESVPEIRFPEFTGDWEQHKFSNIVNRVSKQSNDANLPKVEFEDIISGEGRLNKDISQKLDDRKGIVFEPDFILFGKLRPYLKNWLFPNFKGIALGDFWVFETNNSSSIFTYYLIQTDKYQIVANLSSGTKMPRSDWKTVSETEFRVPTIDEQEKIGNFFKQMDDMIALQQRELDALKETKKAFLQRIFI